MKLFKIIDGRLYYVHRVRRKVRKLKKKNPNYLKYKGEAEVLVKDRLEYFNQFYNYKWGRVTIRDQKTRWGSCSRKGNLNFSYKVALLPANVADYIVVHELCHLEEFNHSQKFWDLVAKTVPEYKEIKMILKKKALELR